MTTWTIRETTRKFDDGSLVHVLEKDGQFVFECSYSLARENIFEQADPQDEYVEVFVGDLPEYRGTVERQLKAEQEWLGRMSSQA